MSKGTVSVLLLVTIAGCATQQLDAGLKGLIGHPVSEAVGRLGYPDSQREMMGDKLYVWSTSHTAVMPIMNTSTTTGSVGGTPIYGQTTGVTMVPMNANCLIQVAVTETGVIKSYQWRGNEMGCQMYARAFRR